jgi:hypothetical protein
MAKKKPEVVKMCILNGCNNTKSSTVFIDISDVALVIGIEKTEELVIIAVELQELIKRPGIKGLKSKFTGTGAFDRLELLEAINNHTPENTDDQAEVQ